MTLIYILLMNLDKEIIIIIIITTFLPEVKVSKCSFMNYLGVFLLFYLKSVLLPTSFQVAAQGSSVNCGGHKPAASSVEHSPFAHDQHLQF